MQQVKWFERRFEFTTNPASFKSMVERMAGAPRLLQETISRNFEVVCNRKPDGKWSVKEHLGHLSVLEPVWRLRFWDILEEKPVMEAADLSNKATHEAAFNKQSIETLCSMFHEERSKTLDLLTGFSHHDLQKSSMHPRLKQQMTCCDLILFIAEHDLHHLNQINNLLNYD